MANSLEKRVSKIERTCPHCGGEMVCTVCHPKEPTVFIVRYEDPIDPEKDQRAAHEHISETN